jgi:hypothetical protein
MPIKFKKFHRLQEMAMANVADLDAEFLKRAQRVTSFNLSGDDFTSLKYKAEIQHLFHIHFFPGFDLDKTIKGRPTPAAINALVKELKRENRSNFNALHAYNLKGVGPSEATLFFLIDDAHLGGGASAGVDLVVGSNNYEVKAGDYSAAQGEQKKFFKNFKLGGTVPLDRIVSKAFQLRDADSKIKAMATERNGVSSKQIKAILADTALGPQWKKEVEAPYQKLAHGYLAKNDLICMINKTPAAQKGECLFIGKPTLSQVHLDVVTQGTIKPKLDV